MKSFILLFILISFAVEAQFSSETTKKIDTIENNTATDITINPTNKVVIPYLTSGELVIDAGTGLQSFANGTEGQLLSITSGVLDFIDPPASSPLTTKGDIYVYDVDNQRLPVGTNGQLLSADSVETTGLKWIDPPVTTPTTTEGDLILRGATEDIRLPIGTTDYLLTSDGNTASWQPAPVSTTLDTKGQIQTYSTENAALDVGLDGTFLVADSTEPTDLKYTASLQGKLNPVTDWVAFTPTGGWTNTTYTGFYRRIGDTMEIQYQLNLTGTPVGSLQLDLPSGFAADEAKMVTDSAASEYRGRGAAYDSSAGFYDVGARYRSDLDIIEPTVFVASSAYTAPGVVQPTIPFTWATGDVLTLNITLPIQNWTSGLDSAVQDIQLTAATANSFSAKVSSTDVVTDEDYDFINGDCTNASTGASTCVFNPDIFTLAPNCECTGAAAARECYIISASPTEVVLQTRNLLNQLAQNAPLNFSCRKQGADVNRSQVIAGTFENIDSTDLVVVEAFSNGGQSITASVTPITFNETSDVQGVWDGDELTAPNNGIYTFAGAEQSTATSNRTIDVWLAPVSTGIYAFKKRCNQSASSTVQKFTCTIVMSTGDKAALRSDVSHTLQSAGSSHDLIITQSADYEAIVKNLYADNVTECETKYLQSNIGNVVGISDLEFTGLDVGKKYEISTVFRYVPTATDTGALDSINNGSVVCRNAVYSASAQTPNPHISCRFTASATTVTHTSQSTSGSSSVTGNGTNAQTYVELCKLPDTTILN